MLRDPALVYERAEEMAALFRQRVAEAEAAAREGLGLAPDAAAPSASV
jgi:small subunit ribosomal protein S1